MMRRDEQRDPQVGEKSFKSFKLQASSFKRSASAAE